jgi:hypothetical protein
MSWIAVGANFARTGAADSESMRSVVLRVLEEVSSNDVSITEALKRLAAGGAPPVTAAQQLFISAARAWIARLGEGEFAKLLATLQNLEQRADERERQIGWPVREWSIAPALGANVPIKLQLDPKVGAYFEVLADNVARPKDVPTAAAFEAAAMLVLNGAIDIGASGTVPGIAPVTATLGLTAGARRSATLHFSYPTHDIIAGAAIAGALSRLGSPAVFDDVQAAFDETRAGRLDAVIVEGDEQIGAEAAVKASVPTSYGTFGFNLEGEAILARDFVYAITKPAGTNLLEVQVRSGSKFTNELDLGVSYSVGLSTIAPGVATALASKVAGISAIIEKMDAAATTRLGAVSSWLKPGTMLKQKIKQNLATVLNAGDADAAKLKNALAGVFGLQTDGAGAAAIAEKLSGLGADLVARLVDEGLQFVGVSEGDLRKRISGALRSYVDDEVLSVLSSKVISKIPVDLDAELTALANSLDAAAKSLINDFLGLDGGAALEQIKAYIDAARKIVGDILAAVSRAQTELLAAEVGWRRARERQNLAAFKISFDGSHATAKEAYRSAILAPRRVGSFLREVTPRPGVVVTESFQQTRLFKSSGPRWSLALIGFDATGVRVRRSDISIIETQDGAVLIAEGEVSKKKTLLKEARTVSFLSATGLVEARAQQQELPLSDAEAKSIISQVTGPRAAASIQLSLEEEDNRIKDKEARKLLSRFVGAQLVSAEAAAAFGRTVDEAQGASADGKLTGSMAISLAIPTEQVVAVLKYARENVGAGVSVADRALSAFDGERIDAAIRRTAAYDLGAPTTLEAPRGAAGAGSTRGLGMERFLPGGATARGFDGTGDIQRRMAFLREVDSISRSIEAEQMPIGGGGARGFESASVEGARREVSRDLENLREARQVLDKSLSIGAQLYFDTDLASITTDEARKRLAEEVEDKQRAMIKTVSAFVKPGLPLPAWIGGKAPESTVALFAALQWYCRDAVGLAPPLIITLKPANSTPISLVAVGTS